MSVFDFFWIKPHFVDVKLNSSSQITFKMYDPPPKGFCAVD